MYTHVHVATSPCKLGPGRGCGHTVGAIAKHFGSISRAFTCMYGVSRQRQATRLGTRRPGSLLPSILRSPAKCAVCPGNGQKLPRPSHVRLDLAPSPRGKKVDPIGTKNNLFSPLYIKVLSSDPLQVCCAVIRGYLNLREF